MSSTQLSFDEGIESVLQLISIDPENQQTFSEDAQKIEKEFVRAISHRDPFFAWAFRGLSLTGCYLYKEKIHLPDEFHIFIRAVDNVAMFLRKGFLPEYLMPDTNQYSDHSVDVMRNCSNSLHYLHRELIECHDRNCMTTEDIDDFFGIADDLVT